MELISWGGPLTITEPATLLTDYLMAALAVWFALVLGRGISTASHVRWWSLSFVFLATSALTGGSYHGFRDELSSEVAEGLWRVTVATGSLCSFALMRAVALQWLGDGRQGLWKGAAALKLSIALVAGLLRPVFAVVIADLGLTMLFAIGAGVIGRERNTRAFRFLTAGVGLFVAGAVIQQARLSPHPVFNHNDLFHVVQILGNASFFVSARIAPPRQR